MKRGNMMERIGIYGGTYSPPHIGHIRAAEYAIEHGWADFAGIGRMVLSYPEMCADVLAGKPLDRRHICRTFGDCTNAPRNGMISGCFPLDEFYKRRPEAIRLNELKKK